MKIIDYLYFLVTSIKGYKAACEGLLRQMFEKEYGFQNGLLMSLGIGLLISVFFYFVICNISYKLAKKKLWFASIIITGLVSYFVTTSYARTSFLQTLKIEVNTKRSLCSGSQEEIEICNNDISAFKTNSVKFIKSTNKYLINYSLTSAFFAILMFVSLSLIFKKYTRYGKAVPFTKIRKTRGGYKN